MSTMLVVVVPRLGPGDLRANDTFSLFCFSCFTRFSIPRTVIEPTQLKGVFAICCLVGGLCPLTPCSLGGGGVLGALYAASAVAAWGVCINDQQQVQHGFWAANTHIYLMHEMLQEVL